MSSPLTQVLILSVMAAASAVMTYGLHPRAPALYLSEAPLMKDEITWEQIQDRWQGQVIWLDARTADAFEKGHIPGARMLNEQGFNEQLLELLDTLQTSDQPVIIYCGGEKCEASRTIREKLLPMVALENCYILKGGWPAWQAAQK